MSKSEQPTTERREALLKKLLSKETQQELEDHDERLARYARGEDQAGATVEARVSDGLGSFPPLERWW